MPGITIMAKTIKATINLLLDFFFKFYINSNYFAI